MSEISKGVINVFSIAVAVVAFLTFLVGSYDFIKNHETNRCDMTYMYQQPEYLEVDLDDKNDFRMYGLYYYAEEWRDINKAKNRVFNGIPVLFIPGNSGSHKQVRSFASVALRKQQDSKTNFHFDFFSISYNEELSALYGYIMDRQSQYARICIEKIRSLYEDFHSVVVIGHSQGGLVARSLLGDGVNIFITLASPHARPILLLDPEQDIFYYSLSRNWSESQVVKTLVSLAGGERDFLVPEKYTASPYNDIHVNTPGVPTVWASTDHLCIVWCKQVVLSVVRSLFDLVQYQNGYYSITNSNYTKDVFNYHLLKEKMNSPGEYGILVVTNSTKTRDWIYGCEGQDIKDGTRYCSSGKNISPEGFLLPSYVRRKKAIHLDGNIPYSHIVVRLDPTPYAVCASVDVYNKKPRGLTKLSKRKGKIYYNFTVNYPKLMAYSVKVSTNCALDDSVGIFTNGQMSHHAFFANSTLDVKFLDTKESSNVELYLDPNCEYTITPIISPLKSMGHIFKTYFRLLPAFIASTIILTMFHQKATEWSNFHIIMLTNCQYLTVVPGAAVSILLKILPNDWLQMLGKDEYFFLLPSYLYLISYVIVLGLATFSWYLIVVAGSAANAIFMRLVTTRLGQLLKWKLPTHVTEIAVDMTFSKFPIGIAVLLVSLCMGTCGALGLSITVFLHYLKLFKMYEEILEDLTRCKIQSVKEALSPINFLFSCSLLWLLVATLNVPSLIFWVNNFKFSQTTQTDLSLYIALMLLPTIAVHWQESVPNFHPLIWKLHRWMLLLMSLCLVIFGSYRLYIISFIITIVLITTALSHLLSAIANYGLDKIQHEREILDAEEEQANVQQAETDERETEDDEVKPEEEPASEEEREKERKIQEATTEDETEEEPEKESEEEKELETTVPLSTETEDDEEIKEKQQTESNEKCLKNSSNTHEAEENGVSNTKEIKENILPSSSSQNINGEDTLELAEPLLNEKSIDKGEPGKKEDAPRT